MTDPSITPTGKVYYVKDAGLWSDVPSNDKLSHIAFCYGIVPENSKAYLEDGNRAMIKFLHAGAEDEVVKVADGLASVNQNRHVMVTKIGGWFPLNIDYSKYANDVKIQQKESQSALRTYVSEEDKKARNEMKEIDDRKEQLKEDEVALEDTDTLEYFTMQMVKQRDIERFIDEGEKKLVEAKNRLRDVKLRNVSLLESNPHYGDLWEEELKRKKALENIGGERPNIINTRVE